jgi:hypothetical protein
LYILFRLGQNQKPEALVSKANNLSLEAGLSKAPTPKSNPDSKPETKAVPVKTVRQSKIVGGSVGMSQEKA